MENHKLSVIIPIYNVAEYLPKCIDSVRSQTYKNLEIILIDDGSTDGSSKISDDYELLDKRIKVLHKTNGGLSSARNAGLELATGEYIAFLDSDDWVDNTIYETLINLLCEYNADVASCNFKEVYPNKQRERSNTGSIICYDRDEAIQELLLQQNIRFEVWNKVYKRRIIGNVRFKDKQIFEDVYFERCVFMKMQRLVFIDIPMYNYLKVREGNTNSKFKFEKLFVFKEFDEFINELKDNKMIEAAESIQAFSLQFSMGLYLQARQLAAPKDIQIKLMEIYKQLYRTSKKNKYINKSSTTLFNTSPALYAYLIKLKEQLTSIIN